jgi:uncharacterized protein YjbI with pentapeptide repeats
MNISPSDLATILDLHSKWLRDEPEGKRADLAGANLTRANLYGADLSMADLSGASLSMADLTRANLYGADLSMANLSGADLTRANLAKASLSMADLTRANLAKANLSGAVHTFASVEFLGHGECGRTLTAIRLTGDAEPTFQCGCFFGTQAELQEYIFEGDPKYRKTRTRAMEIALELLDLNNETP